MRITETFLEFHQCNSQMAADMINQITKIVESRGLKVCRLINAEGRAMTAQAQWLVHTAEFRISLFMISNSRSLCTLCSAQFESRCQWRSACSTWCSCIFLPICRNCMRSSLTTYSVRIWDLLSSNGRVSSHTEEAQSDCHHLWALNTDIAM